MRTATLRSRLILLVGGVSTVAVCSVAWVSFALSQRAFERSFDLDIREERPAAPSPDPTHLIDYYRSHQSWSGVGPLLEGLAETDVALLIDEHGNVHLSPSLSTWRGKRLDDGRIELLQGESRRWVLRLPEQRLIVDDREVGRLSVFSRSLDEPIPSDPRVVFSATTGRWALATVLLFSILSVLAAILMAGRLTRPIEALTKASRRIARGDLEVRVREARLAELRDLGVAFNRMAETMAKTETLRRQFVDDIAHELRTPLTNARCQLEALIDGMMPLSTDAVVSVEEELNVLQRLVEDLEILARADAGHLAMSLEEVDLRAEVESALHVVRRQRTVDVDGPEALPVRADTLRLRQILTNLLSNAMASSPEDSPLTIRFNREGAFAQVDVLDRGRGLPEGDLERVFERFYRTDPSRARATGGSGLGLSIVKRLVDAHGGRVWSRNREDGGAVFSFTLACVPDGETDSHRT